MSRHGVARRWFITRLPFALAAAPLAVEAQQTRPRHRIGYLAAFSATAGGIDAFRDRLRESGYIEGVNVIVESRFAEGRYAQLQSLAEELVALKVDVIVAWTTPAAVAGQRATKTIPIVFANVSDPVRNGLVASLARPGGNLTGCTDITADLVQRRLALLKELLPRVTTESSGAQSPATFPSSSRRSSTSSSTCAPRSR
jgi:putative ABC transport system substrate-binding protein